MTNCLKVSEQVKYPISLKRSSSKNLTKLLMDFFINMIPIIFTLSYRIKGDNLSLGKAEERI